MRQCENHTKQLKPCFGRGKTPRSGVEVLGAYILTVIFNLTIKKVI